MCGYYRNFVKNCSTVASPLTDLTRLDTPWDWSDECEGAFKRLKHALMNHEVLMVPDPQKQFIVTTDASQYVIGAVLAQQDGKKLRPIEYMSKKTPSKKLAKSTYERELYALYKALVHWRHFLLGRRSMLPPAMDGQVDIDHIVDHRDMPVPKPLGRGRPPKPKREYRIRFRHHTDPKEDRWFTREELMETAPQVVADYEQKLKGKAPANCLADWSVALKLLRVTVDPPWRAREAGRDLGSPQEVAEELQPKMAGGSRKLPNLAEGRIPGYSGYIPSMKNHLVGNRYSESTRRAKECTDLIKAGYNPSGEKRLVDMRPQGREYLYAQVAPMSGAPRYQYDPRVCFYRVQKRRAPRYMTKFLGIVDVPSMNTVVGGPGTGPVQLLQMKSASLPEQSFKDRSIQTRRIFPEELPEVALDTRGQVPGYTGHQHAGQHLFAKSYGSTTRQLVVDVPDGDTIKKSKRFLYFRDARPIGDILTEKHRIPGYQV
ncbi:hypothetical protein CBR_g32165 [Chara braunii]|uniref:Reverse transcriptase/retrotransposon-derived protein RNase H-like domain-containing protein n=1 Tax=Chara braunii TaxID=69332 RepID=A0A388JMY4_CHABU|nr:hypothetical protein CBR_g32165 [Chara braunii]|eukprot:GBG59148.1 hypothetical protein CBR_g32165 [Chara braunii]